MQEQIEIIRHLGAIRRPLQEFWTAHCKTVDADPACLRFLLETDSQPYIAVCSDGEPKAMLVGRVIKTKPLKIGRRAIPSPNVKIILISNGGWLGEIDDSRAARFTEALKRSLIDGEADAVLFHYLETNSALARHVRMHSPMLCRDHSSYLHKRQIFEIPPDIKQVLAKKNKRANKLKRNYTVEIKKYRTETNELMALAELITAKSSHRRMGIGFRASDEMRSRLDFLARAGWLRGYVLYLDGKPAAYWIGTQRAGVFTGHYIAYDPDQAAYSPGMYLMVECIEMLAREEKVFVIDWGFGDQEYKRRLTTHARDVASIYMFAPRPLGIIVNLMRVALERINKVGRWLFGLPMLHSSRS